MVVTGIWWVDLCVIPAMMLAALSVIYKYALLPPWRVIRRIRRVFRSLAAAVELTDDFPPAVAATLVSLPAQIDRVNDRIDEHMTREEADRGELNAQIADIKSALDTRTTLFDDLQNTMHVSNQVIANHISADDARFDSAGAALVEGQNRLEQRLVSIEAKLPPS